MGRRPSSKPPLNITRVEGIPDSAIDIDGHRINGTYVELFWTPQLGPTASILLRRLIVDGPFDRDTVAAEIGVSAPILDRAVKRLCERSIARLDEHTGVLYVRRRLWTVSNRMRVTWPTHLREMHRQYLNRHTASDVMSESRSA